MAEKNITLKDLIKDIDYRLTHLEDIEADNRQLMIKLVKQSNQVVEFLRDLQIDEVDPYDIPYNPPKPKDLENTRSIKDLVKQIKEGSFDFGVAFDGDADRVVAVDEKGNIVRSDIFLSSVNP